MSDMDTAAGDDADTGALPTEHGGRAGESAITTSTAAALAVSEMGA